MDMTGKYLFLLPVPEVSDDYLVVEVRGEMDGMPVVRRQKIFLSYVTIRDWVEEQVEDLVVSSGNVINIVCTFRDWSGNLIDPHDPTVMIYNQNKKPLIKRYHLPQESRIGEGEYVYQHRVSGSFNPFYIEFSGMVLGKNLVVRREVQVEWVKGLPSLCK